MQSEARQDPGVRSEFNQKRQEKVPHVATAEQHRKWCWCAALSTAPGQVSVLAIVETILAMAVAIGLGIWLNRWGYVFLASLVAPLLLLRTDESVQLGITLFKPDVEWVRRRLPMNEWHTGFSGPFLIQVRKVARFTILKMFLNGLYVTAWSISVRIAATLWTVARHPFHSLRAILVNWKEACLITDFTKELEFMPGLRFSSPGALFLFVGMPGPPAPTHTECLRQNLPIAPRILAYTTMACLGVLALPFAVGCAVGAGGSLIHMAAWWYRFSLKSTAIVWLPLLYVATDVAADPKTWSAKRRLLTICTAATAKVMRVYALVVGLFLLAKFGSQIVWYKTIAAWERSSEWLSRISPLLRPIDVPVWQVCSLINAVAA